MYFIMKLKVTNTKPLLPPIPHAGVLGIGRLAMQAESVIDHASHFNLESSNIHMRFASLITADQITVTAGQIHMEGDAALDVTGQSVI